MAAWTYCDAFPRAQVALLCRWTAPPGASPGADSPDPRLAVRLLDFPGDGGATGLLCVQGEVSAGLAPNALRKDGAEFVRALHACLTGETPRTISCTFGYEEEDGAGLELLSGDGQGGQKLAFTLRRTTTTGPRKWDYRLALDEIVFAARTLEPSIEKRRTDTDCLGCISLTRVRASLFGSFIPWRRSACPITPR